MHKRRKFIAGNWKMNTLRDSARRLAASVVTHVDSIAEVEIAVCPPFVYLIEVHDALSGSPVRLGAQDVYFAAPGAFTGEIAAAMLADCGCKYVIVGHSERRHVLGETDEAVNRKITAALAAGLHPILCVGELLSQRESGKTEDVVGHQLRNALVGVRPEQVRDITIAYEPVWAIGTGKVATPDEAEAVHAFIRSTITTLYGADLAQNLTIQYGGSVKGDNALGLLRQPNVDGALVGGASLKAEEFSEIVRAAAEAAA